jgi:ribosomal protein L37AE/L43A
MELITQMGARSYWIKLFGKTKRDRAIFMIEIHENAERVFYTCPICHEEEIMFTFYEHRVENCKGQEIDPTVAQICERCQFVLENPAWEDITQIKRMNRLFTDVTYPDHKAKMNLWRDE